MNRWVLVAVFLGFLMMGGCYTQLGTIKNTPEKIPQIVDSNGDTLKQNIQVDTVVVKERQNCIWERDIWGYPQLHCYDSYYPRDWFFYTRTPWWFRNDPYWYDYRRCPRYYYYDQSCGRCRHYQDHSYHYQSGGSGGSGSYHPQDPVTPGTITTRSRSGGLTVIPSSSNIPKTNQTPVVPQQNTSPDPIHRDRSSGVSDMTGTSSNSAGQQDKVNSGSDLNKGNTNTSNEEKQDTDTDEQRYRGRKNSRGL